MNMSNGEIRSGQGESKCGQAALVCNVGDMKGEVRTRWRELTESFHALRSESVETDTGYRFRFASDAENLLTVAEWIGHEQICCPFFVFDLHIEASDPYFYLEIAGPDGAKEIIRSEILGG